MNPLLARKASTANSLMWWAKIYTTQPFCIYYFGPFDRLEDAQQSRFGYIEDLEQEGAKVVFVKFLQRDPQNLTVEYKNLNRVRWLHELMQDSLMLRVAYEPEVLKGESDRETTPSGGSRVKAGITH